MAALRCGRGLDKAGALLERLAGYTSRFLDIVEAADLRTLDDGTFDQLANPSMRLARSPASACPGHRRLGGPRRVAGVDLGKERMRRVCGAVSALACDPRGFRVKELAARVRAQEREPVPAPEANIAPKANIALEANMTAKTNMASQARMGLEASKERRPGSTVYNQKKAGYDLGKLRAKGLIERIEHTHCYRVKVSGMRVLSGALCMRQCILKPVLAGLAEPGTPPPPKPQAHRLDALTLSVQSALHDLLCEVGLAA